MAAETHIVVLGAGVSGLTSALLLSRNPGYKITVAAAHMPGDYSIDYASPWAGANYLPVSAPGTAAAEHDRHTWPELQRLAAEHPEAGVHFQEARNFARASDSGPIASWQHEPQNPRAWFKEVVPDFRVLREQELRGYDSGTSFTSVCINTALYLPWLASQCLAAGVVFRRAVLTHIAEAAELFVSSPTSISGGPPSTSHGHGSERADIIVNATGLSSHKLGGVKDSKMYPARAQIALVRNTAPFMACTSGTDDGEAECCYIMQRAAGGGTVLGGCYQVGNWDEDVDMGLADRIMRRCVRLVPELVEGVVPTKPDKREGWKEESGEEKDVIGGGKEDVDISKLSLVRHGVGLRPCRKGGVRLERERIGDTWVVHNYGHGGFGYQSSYGCAMEVIRLVRACVEEIKGAAVPD